MINRLGRIPKGYVAELKKCPLVGSQLREAKTHFRKWVKKIGVSLVRDYIGRIYSLSAIKNWINPNLVGELVPMWVVSHLQILGKQIGFPLKKFLVRPDCRRKRVCLCAQCKQMFRLCGKRVHKLPKHVRIYKHKLFLKQKIKFKKDKKRDWEMVRTTNEFLHKQSIGGRGMYTLSDKGFEFLRRHEGYMKKVYVDTTGHPTVGIGHLITGKEVPSIPPVGKSITDERVKQLFDEDKPKYEAPINRLVKVKLTQYQFDALFAFVYNIGPRGFSKSRTLQLLNMGQYNAAGTAMLGWLKNKELRGRRHDEVRLFIEGKYV